MSIPYARLGIPAPLRRSVDPGAPKTAKMAVAKGLLPTTSDVQLALLYVLAVDSDASVAAMARETLSGMPEDQVLSGISQNTFPKILEFIAEFRTDSARLDERLIHIRGATTRAAVRIARRASPELCETICRHQERLLLSPEVFVALHANESCEDEILGRAESFLRMHNSLPAVPAHRPFREPEPEPAPAPEAEAPVSPPSLLSPESPLPAAAPPAQEAPAPTPMQAPQASSGEKLKMFALDELDADEKMIEDFQFDFQDEMESFSWDLTGDEDEAAKDEEEEGFISIERRIGDMTVGEKIKLAYLGNKQARKVLVRDSNKIVASAVVKSGRLSPSEVASFAGNRNLADDVVREIAMNREFTRKYPVQVALANNPKTPPSVALRFISHLNKRDLKALSNNRNVSSVIFTAAKKAFKAKYQK